MSTKTLPCYGSAAEEGGFKGERVNSVKMPRLPKTLPAEEKKYLLAVDRGDVAAVTRMIRKAQQDGSLNINCVDPLGRGALLMAIDGENLAMVETLIVNGVRTADSLLHAIDKQFVEAVELLLEHEELVHKEGDPYSWENIDRDTATFTPEITPLILASHRNNYEILKILLDRGATLPMPHDFRFPDIDVSSQCTCHTCVEGVRGDCLRHSASRINSYKALASPSLIALTSTDPLLTSFELSWELKQLAIAEKEFRTDYLELRKQSSDFAVSLLSQTRTSHELEVMLNFDPHNARDDMLGFEDSDEGGLARLRLAIKYKQKKFVAHASVQQFLSAMWYEGLPGFRQKSTLGKCIEIVQIIATFPLYCLLYMIAPNSSTAKLMRKPFMKFLTHASSYLFFLFLLILVSQRVEEQVKGFLWGEDSSIVITGQESIFRKKQRGNPPQYLEYFVAIYVLGFIVEETRELFRSGFMSYVSNMWNAIDFLRNVLYCAVFFLRAWAYMDQNREIAIDPEKAYIPREEWDDFDPQLIAEGLFAAANIFSALKLVHVSTINPHLGPLQISLGRMVFDILKFFFFYTLVLFAFACGLNQLLWYFADLEKQKCYSLPGGLPDWNRAAESCMKWRRFGNLFESSQSLFWASFGMVGLSDFELTGIKSYTRFWGLLMFGSYCVINVIVLLNLLIAMLSNTYAAIEEKADTEWKFARTKLWLSYFDEDGSLPSPFNLLPTPKSIKRLLTRFIPNLAKIGTSLKKREAKMAELREQAMQYRSVMRALVWRYVSGLQRKSEETVVSEDDIHEVKGEISALRCDLVELFRRNGMNVTSVTQRPVATARKTREWERRLLRGFHVAPAAGDENLDIIDSELDKPEKDALDAETTKEGGADRFRRMARLALLNRDIVSRPPHHLSHIGKSTSSESFSSRQSLKQAMDEARRMVLGSIQKSPKSQHEGKETSGAVPEVKSQSAKLQKQDSIIEESEKQPSSVTRAAASKFSLKAINKQSMETNESATDSSTTSQIQNSVTFSDDSTTEVGKSANSNIRPPTVKPMKSASNEASIPIKPTTASVNSASRQPLDPASILKSAETSRVTDKNVQKDANVNTSVSTPYIVDDNKSKSAMDTQKSEECDSMLAPGSAKPVEVFETIQSTQSLRELPTDGSGSVSVSIYQPQQIKPDTSVNMDLSKRPVTPTDLKQPSFSPNSSTKVSKSKGGDSKPTVYKTKRADGKAPAPDVPVHSKSLSVTALETKEDVRPASEALTPSNVVKNMDGSTASSAKEPTAENLKSTASVSCKSKLRAPFSLDVETKQPTISATSSQTSNNIASTASLKSPPSTGKKSDSQLLLPSVDNVKTIKKSGAWF